MSEFRERVFGQNGAQESEQDRRLIVWFYDKAVVDPGLSKEAQRPVHKKVTFVHIQQPAERDVYDQPATQEHINRFPARWSAYQNGREDAPDGTLLAVLFPNNPEIVDNLKVLKIFTVEQLANLNDTQVQNIGMGGQSWRSKAIMLLAGAESGKGFAELEDKVAKLTIAMEASAARCKALEEALEEAKDKKRGKAA